MPAAHPIHSAEQALERLASLPGGAELNAAARQRQDIVLVGGAVRDLLLGHWPRELDVTVESDAAGLAALIAATVSPSERAYGHPVEPTLHERFGTASVAWEYGRIDIAERRAESYAAPGALPQVRPGSLEDDLARRDFTVNAISIPLAGSGRGVLTGVEGAVQDLAGGVLRVLHERSFLDDPTRLLRLGRYAARLGFEIEPHTLQLALAAVAGGALETVSGGRAGAELWLAAAEPDGAASLAALDSLGVLAALGLASPFDAALAREALALLPHDGHRDLLLMACAFPAPPAAAGRDEHSEAMIGLMTRLEFTREQQRAVLEIAAGAERLLQDVARAGSDVDAFAVSDGSRPELAARALALAARASEPAAQARLRAWLETERHVRLDIDGGDLIAAGVAEGPEIGRRLEAALRAKREGSAPGREQQLAAALGGTRQEAM
jgi:tRNA nucleotidyltransferase (CCA-adding enzyme)